VSDSVFLIAGEPSGDLHAGRLINALQEIAPSIEYFGLGGDKCVECGMELFAHVRDISFMGLWDVLPAIPRMKMLEAKLVLACRERRPKVAILIDYPGFNLSIAPKLKKLNIPVIYYISPQFWAWHEGRVEKVRRYVDKMIVILPFEVEFYRKHNVDVEFVGHPFVDIVKPSLSESEFRTKYDIVKPFILLLPGSRRQEVKRHLPIMLQTAKLIRKKHDIDFAILVSKNIDSAIFDDAIDSEFENVDHIHLVDDNSYSAMTYAKFGIVSSGSATLECGVAGLPIFIVYKTDPLSYWLAKSMIKVEFIGLVNLVMGRAVAGEFIQKDADPDQIAAAVDGILSNADVYNALREEYHEIRNYLGEPGAAKRVASIVYRYINDA
jgi:lipid-A-disaccharide synthase